jgi:pyruvate/oxaloacetate carboxyltransferase
MAPQKDKVQKKKVGKIALRNPVKITDTTFRDGHQSTLATRMRTEDMLPIAARMNKVGFHSMEVWGGATFDVPTRFLAEDPWDRLRVLKKEMPDTPLQMLLRGQNLVGYRQYPDDVVRAFVKESAEAGIDVFRVFDALNDERNFETSFDAVKEAGKQIQGTICYSLTERRMGGPVFNIKYYTQKAKTLEKMGADILCVKDMAGIISPYDAYDLISALKDTVDIPICLHTLPRSFRAAFVSAGHRADPRDAARDRPRPRARPERTRRTRPIRRVHLAEIQAVPRHHQHGGYRYARARAPDTRRHDHQPGQPT